MGKAFEVVAVAFLGLWACYFTSFFLGVGFMSIIGAVNNGIWSFLDYVERHRCWSPSPPSFKFFIQTFCLYCYIYFIPLVFTY